MGSGKGRIPARLVTPLTVAAWFDREKLARQYLALIEAWQAEGKA